MSFMSKIRKLCSCCLPTRPVHAEKEEEEECGLAKVYVLFDNEVRGALIGRGENLDRLLLVVFPPLL